MFKSLAHPRTALKNSGLPRRHSARRRSLALNSTSRSRGVAFAFANIASDVDIGQKVHLDLDEPSPWSLAAALDVNENRRLVAAPWPRAGGEPFAIAVNAPAPGWSAGAADGD